MLGDFLLDNSTLTEQVEINQAVIFGDNKPFLIALIHLEEKLSKSKIESMISKINKRLNSIERIRKYILLKKPLTYQDGFLTQTQKIKKKKVFSHFKNDIEKLY